MTSTPIRCDYCRLHRDPATVCECHERRQLETQSARSQLARRNRSEGSVTRRGRATSRPFQAPPSPPRSESSRQDFSPPPSSPLTRLTRRVAGVALRSRGTHSPSPRLLSVPPQFRFGSEDEDEDEEEQEEAIITASPPPSATAATAAATPPPMTSPASTQFVTETPLAHLLAHPQNPLAAAALPSSEAGIADYATHPDSAVEIQRLRQSRNGLVRALQASTAHVGRLQARLLVCTGGEDVVEVRQSERRGVVRKWRWERLMAEWRRYLSGILMLVVVLYFVWMWVNAPEIEYIRRRRMEVLCE